ncbi:hypothetical protein [Fusobacterium sp.]|uniref:hypothetical protein n=1 Tax=Fusobacterium sp. TaxID=68766 RepID=UPI0026213DB5|nr:hypothetical protein [Fusobacterium sp.]
MTVKSIVVAYKAQMNQQMGGAVDILGSFDNMIQPMFPVPMRHMSIVITIEGIIKPTTFEVRINGVNDDLITKGEFMPMVDPFGVGKKILDLENILIKDRGRYTIDVLEKTADGKHKFMSSHTLFIADYPPQRQFTPELVEKILATDDVIKLVKTEFTPVGMDKTIKIQHNLDKNAPLEEGYISIPEGDKITINEKEFDLMGLRRQIEWMFGNPLPKKEETTSEEKAPETPQA